MIGDEIFHVPVGFRLAGIKDKGLKRVHALVLIGRPRGLALVIDAENRVAAQIDGIAGVDLHAVHHAVGAAVEDDALDARHGFQLLFGKVVGINFAVNAQRTDLTSQAGIFLAAQIQNQDAILLHYKKYLLYRIISHSIIVPDAVLPCK